MIKSSCANFGVKRQVFLSILILVQECQFWAKKNIVILGEMLTFYHIVYTNTESNYLFLCPTPGFSYQRVLTKGCSSSSTLNYLEEGFGTLFIY